jgi:hypothetical protein
MMPGGVDTVCWRWLALLRGHNDDVVFLEIINSVLMVYPSSKGRRIIKRPPGTSTMTPILPWRRRRIFSTAAVPTFAAGPIIRTTIHDGLNAVLKYSNAIILFIWWHGGAAEAKQD